MAEITWETLSDNIDWIVDSIVFNDMLYMSLYVSGFSPTIMRSSNGEDWDTVETGIVGFFAIKNDILYLLKSNSLDGSIYYTTNGTDWFLITASATIGPAFYVWEKDNYFYGRILGYLARSADAETWIGYPSVPMAAEEFIDFQNTLYGINYDYFLRSSNGIDWSTVPAGLEGFGTCLGKFNGYLYAGTAIPSAYVTGKLYRSLDGDVWEEVEEFDLGSGYSHVRRIIEYNSRLYVAIADGKVYESDNGIDFVDSDGDTGGHSYLTKQIYKEQLYFFGGSSGSPPYK